MCVCVCNEDTNSWKTVGTFHRTKAGHSNIPMIFVRCIILVTYNESQLITTFRTKKKKHWKDSGRVCRVCGGANYQLQESKNIATLRFTGTDSGTWKFCVMFCVFYLAFSLSFGMKVRFLHPGAKEGSTWYFVVFRTSCNLIIRY